MNKIVGIFAGGFKPPTKGHFEVVKEALNNNPQIDTFYVYIGKKDRDGISQEDSYKVWSLYSKYLPNKVEYIKTTVPPIKAVFDYSKENPDHQILWILGARQGNEDDFKDISSRTKTLDKYPNLTVETVILPSAVSGTAARNALKVSKEKFIPFLPDELNETDIMQIYAMLSNQVTEENNFIQDKNILNLAKKYNITSQQVIDYLVLGTKKELEYTDNQDLAMESAFNMLWKDINYYNNINETLNLSQNLNEEASYSNHIDYKHYIKDLTQNMIDQGMNIKPLPKVKFIHNNSSNAQNFFGKTAYYDPNNKEIVLYTEGRHPRDIISSFCHELIHHIQHLEGRLNNISTSNVLEDDELKQLEREAYEGGGIMLRAYKDFMRKRS